MKIQYKATKNRVVLNNIMVIMVRVAIEYGRERPSTKVELRSDGSFRFRVHIGGEVAQSVTISVVIVVVASDMVISVMGKENVYLSVRTGTMSTIKGSAGVRATGDIMVEFLSRGPGYYWSF